MNRVEPSADATIPLSPENCVPGTSAQPLAGDHSVTKPLGWPAPTLSIDCLSFLTPKLVIANP
jgi:hypothetical protein